MLFKNINTNRLLPTKAKLQETDNLDLCINGFGIIRNLSKNNKGKNQQRWFIINFFHHYKSIYRHYKLTLSVVPQCSSVFLSSKNNGECSLKSTNNQLIKLSALKNLSAAFSMV